MGRPTRLILNFAHRCNMACEWCYIPFGGSRPDADTCLRIVERCAELGMLVVTFGGGDPFIYPFFPDLLRAAKRLGLSVHVDTNAIALRASDATAKLIEESIDLIGLPLDGPDARIHGVMRSSTGHFDLLMKRLDWLRPHRGKLKINTIVTAVNAASLPELGRLVGELSPARWSIYQYWPLSLGAAVAQRYRIDQQSFVSAVGALDPLGHIQVEVNSLPSRRLTYPFVSHDGALYVHSLDSLDDYEALGSFFDDKVVEEMFRVCGAERADAQSRYRYPRRGP